MKKTKTFLMLLISVSLIVTLSAAKKAEGGKPGGGGGGASTTYPVTFVFDDTFSGATIGSDGGGAYVDGVDGVRAEFVAAGNPILSLRSKKIKRDLYIDYSGCTDNSGNRLTDGDEPETRANAYVSHVGGVFDNLGKKIADNVLLMQVGQSGFTEMDTTYSPPTGGREGFSIRFGGEDGSQNIKITRDSQTQWTVENENSAEWESLPSTAAVGTVRNGSFTPKGLCKINVRMTITCPDCP